MKIRYTFDGKLVLESGLHIGGGSYNTTYTDSPVVKTPAGLPYIPGSSFKGVFRSTAEKLANNESIRNLETCLLDTRANDEKCLTTIEDKKNRLYKVYEKLRDRNDETKLKFTIDDILDWENLISGIQKQETPDKEQVLKFLNNECKQKIQEWRNGTTVDKALKESLLKAFNEVLTTRGFYEYQSFKELDIVEEAKSFIKKGLNKLNKDELKRFNRLVFEAIFPYDIENTQKLLDFLNIHLCFTCKLFGSPFKASKAYFSDLYLDTSSFSGLTEIRDGVAIDRDSETAVDGYKYDYEVVQAGTTFDLKIVLEDPDDLELGLFLAVISEFENSYAYLGGNRSRGLGKCRIDDLKIRMLDFGNGEQLRNYLIRKECPLLSEKEKEDLINEKIEYLFI